MVIIFVVLGFSWGLILRLTGCDTCTMNIQKLIHSVYGFLSCTVNK